VKRLDQLAQERYSRGVLDLAVRWVLDQGITTALWGARRPDQLDPVGEVMGWHLDSSAKAEIEQILTTPSPIPWARSSWRLRNIDTRSFPRRGTSDPLHRRQRLEPKSWASSDSRSGFRTRSMCSQR
jgi:hypothetical protein